MYHLVYELNLGDAFSVISGTSHDFPIYPCHDPYISSD